MASKTFSLSTASTVQAKGYKFKDINKSLNKLNRKRLEYVNDKSNPSDISPTLIDIQCVMNGLRNLFTWSKGERIILPEFGLNLRQYLYEPMTNDVVNGIRTEIVSQINRWEPRVSIEFVKIDQYPDENMINITITFSIPSLSKSNIIFTELIK